MASHAVVDEVARRATEEGLPVEGPVEAGPVVDWADRLAAEGFTLPIHLGIAGPAKLQTLIKFAIACGVGPSLKVLQKRAMDVSKLLLPYEPNEVLAELAAHRQSFGKGRGDGDLFTELADQFLGRMPGWIRQLDTAARDHDSERVRRQAHRLLGLCRQIGAERMAALCEGLENMSEDEAAEMMESEVARLQSEFETVYRELDDRHLSD